MSEQLVPCPHCGQLIHPQARVCRFCGRSMTARPKKEPSEAPAAPQAPQLQLRTARDVSRSSFPWLWVILLVILALLAGAALVIF